MLSVSVGSLEPQSGRLLYEKKSPVTRLSLGPDEERVILVVDRHAPFPLHVSVKMLFYTPTKDDFVRVGEENLEEEEEFEEEGEGKEEKEETEDVGSGNNGDVTSNPLGDESPDGAGPSDAASLSGVNARRNLTLCFGDAADLPSSSNGLSSSSSSSPSSSGSNPFPVHPISPQSLKPESASRFLSNT